MDAKKTAIKIEEEAASWVIRLDRDGRSEALLSDLENWLGMDSRHAGAFLQAEAAWALLGKVQAAKDTASSPRRSRNGRQSKVRWLSAALAAGLALIAVHFGLDKSADVGSASSPGTVERYTTEQGEISTVALADGSSVSMNSSSALTVDYRNSVRALKLDAGEVWFDVAKDESRPFLVAVGDTRVRAVGTGFAVHLTAEATDVSVTEGTVEVWTTDSPADLARLGAGTGVVVASERVGPVEQRGIKQVEERLQWRYRRIDLGGQTLQQAVGKFNQYNRRKLVIADPRINGERLHGVFQLNDVEGFARAVEASLGIPVDYRHPDRIVLGRAPKP